MVSNKTLFLCPLTTSNKVALVIARPIWNVFFSTCLSFSSAYIAVHNEQSRHVGSSRSIQPLREFTLFTKWPFWFLRTLKAFDVIRIFNRITSILVSMCTQICMQLMVVVIQTRKKQEHIIIITKCIVCDIGTGLIQGTSQQIQWTYR